MAYKLIISVHANKDLDKATRYYLDIRKSLAKKLTSDIRSVAGFIHKNPEKIQIRYSNIRVAYLKKFPYGIHYTFENKTIVILAIFHTAMDSEKWTRR